MKNTTATQPVKETDVLPSVSQPEPAPKTPDSTKPEPSPDTAIAKPRLGELYSAIDAAPNEWVPSLLARIVQRSVKSKVWTDTGDLLVAVKNFADKSA